ncbi:unnamed protein product [Boreogadus saida]
MPFYKIPTLNPHWPSKANISTTPSGERKTTWNGSSELQPHKPDRSALIVPDELLHFPANVSRSAIGKESNEGKSLPPWRCHFHTLRLAACQADRTLGRGGLESAGPRCAPRRPKSTSVFPRCSKKIHETCLHVPPAELGVEVGSAAPTRRERPCGGGGTHACCSSSERDGPARTVGSSPPLPLLLIRSAPTSGFRQKVSVLLRGYTGYTLL